MADKRNMKQALRDGEALLGIFQLTPEPDIVEVLGHAGLDFALIDGEHGHPGLHSELPNLTRAADAVGLGTLVRFPNHESTPALIGHALDCGLDGVQISDVETGEQIERAVQAAYYAPRGSRSIHPINRSGNFSWRPLDEHIERSNQRTVVIAQVESVPGVENLDEILDNDGVDAVFIGPMDLSQSMGLILQTQHPDVQAAVDHVVERVLEAGKTLGYLIKTPDDAKYWLDRGARLLCLSGAQLWRPFGNLVNSIRQVVDEE